jgi:hypothetical protein
MGALVLMLVLERRTAPFFFARFNFLLLAVVSILAVSSQP